MTDNFSNQFPFHINSVGVNKFEAPTIIELLNDYFNKIIEVVTQSNTTEQKVNDNKIYIDDVKQQTLDFMNWVKVQGIPDETLKLLNLWLSNGTLEDLINQTILSNINTKVDANDNKIIDWNSLKTYSSKITRDSMYWNIDPMTGIDGAWSNRQIGLIGDSHAWGEGGTNYQGISTGYSLHCPWVHNKGFYGMMLDYLYKKYDSEPWRVIPLYDRANPIPKTGTGAVVYTGSYSSKESSLVNKDTFTRKPRIVKGKYYISVIGSSDESLQVYKDGLKSFCNAETREDTYSVIEYKYNADIGLFGKGVLNFAPDTGESCVLFDMDKPSRYAIVHLTSGIVTGSKVKIEMLDYMQCNNDGTENYNQATNGYGDGIYGLAVPSVYVLSNGADNTSPLVTPANVTITPNYIEIDTSYAGMSYEAVYIIDFKQKKKGTLRMKHNGNGVNYTANNGILGSSAINTRGVIFGNGDLFKNWGMGGHTTGALLGLESSFSNETRNHIADIKSYMTGSMKAILIEAPLVNEWLKQTPIQTFKDRLSLISTNLNVGNVIVFTTLGLKNREYGTDEGTIKFNDYAKAVEDWANDPLNTKVTFVDCRKYLINLVSSGIISDYNHLWINNGHPSPMCNKIMFEMVKRILDMKF